MKDEESPSRRAELHKHVSDFFAFHGQGAYAVLVGADAADARLFRQRHGASRILITSPSLAVEPCEVGGGVLAQVGPCTGLREIVDALLLASCDFLITEGHSAAEFAMWWNARLQEPHHHLDLGNLHVQCACTCTCTGTRT